MPSPFVTTMCFTIRTSPAMTPVSPHGAAEKQKQPTDPPTPAYQGWWGVRPKSPVTSQPPSLVDLLYREDPHILCFREACQRPSLPSLFGMPYGHSLSCLLIRRYHMSAVTFCLLLYVPRYQLAQTPVSPRGAAGQQKQTPPIDHASSQGGTTWVPPPFVYYYVFHDTN